jgi:hypothetical protein
MNVNFSDGTIITLENWVKDNIIFILEVDFHFVDYQGPVLLIHNVFVISYDLTAFPG